MTRFVHVTEEGVAPYASSLRALEASIRYPLADGADHFTIDHGAQYHPFFSRLGEAHFLLALQNDRVVGSIVGVIRQVSCDGSPLSALYLCDLKVAADVRGHGVARRMLQHGVVEILKHPRARKARLLYGAAMRAASGDVMRTARGFNPLRLGAHLASLRLYFVEPRRLAALQGEGPEVPRLPALELSGGADPVVDTRGAKDLRLASTGKPWPLVHLTLAPWKATGGWGSWLRVCGEALAARPDAPLACLALDERLEAHHRWLGAAGIEPGAGCTVYGLALSRRVRAAGLLHLATSEI